MARLVERRVLRFGPIELAPWHLILIGVGLLIVLWLLRGFTVRVSGTWERVDEGLRSGQRELITLVQFGPFVRGRRMMNGGFQEYTGILRGRTIFMTRRDHGHDMIVAQGFPKEIAAEINGTVTARLRLTLSADTSAIFGSFTPQKIEFTYKPPAITGRIYLEPSFRRYKLVSRELVDSEVIAATPEDSERAPVRRTV